MLRVCTVACEARTAQERHRSEPRSGRLQRGILMDAVRLQQHLSQADTQMISGPHPDVSDLAERDSGHRDRGGFAEPIPKSDGRSCTAQTVIGPSESASTRTGRPPTSR
jgi:hypothetical protein